MSKTIKTILNACIPLFLLAAGLSYATTVIGSWEGTADGWIDWGNKESIDSTANMPSKYQYATIGATRGSQSLQVIQSGWGQSLAIQLTPEQRTVFMNSTTFSIDVTVAASNGLITQGYSQISEVVMNAPGAGWTVVAGNNPVNFYWWADAPQRTQTLTINYSDFRNRITTTDYIEIIFALNTGGGAPPEMYFDNARLTGSTRPYRDLVMELNPRLYLRFEGPTLADSSTFNRWVQQRPGASFVQKTGMGNCMYFDGGSNGCVAASVVSDPSWGSVYGDQYAFAKGQISFEFWAKIESMSQYGMFFQQIGPWNRENFAPGFGQIATSDNTLGNFRILNGTTDPNDQDFWYPGVAVPTDGRWHHYVITYHEQYGGNPNLMQIQLFVDGSLVGSTVVGQPGLPAKLGPELDHLVIGGENNRGYVYNTFKGWMDEFAIYPIVLDADRVAMHYARGRMEIEPQNCEQVFLVGQGLAADFDRNCIIDLRDLAYVAQSWLICNDPALFGLDPKCGPTW